VRTMPQQKPGRSLQTQKTPKRFLEAVRKRFGQFRFDLACLPENSVVPEPNNGEIFTPYRSFLNATGEDLACELPGVAWCNPPFGNITVFSRKCRALAPMLPPNICIAFLTPASVGAKWFWNNIQPWAYVYLLVPRMSFDEKNAYPKDLMLSVFRNHETPGMNAWYWTKGEKA
jgi:hypothetical protein